MQVRVLGGIEVLAPVTVALGGPTQRRTLALLLMNAGEVVSLDRMIDGVWPNGDTPERAEHNVQTYVHRLRSAIGKNGSRIETVGTGYRLQLDRDELDAHRFEDLLANARSAMAEADTDRALASIDEALGLWRGRPYDDVADLDWARAEVARLDELHASAIERRFEALLADGRHNEVIGPLREAVAGEPWREARRGQLALALYRAGRQAEALRAIQDYRSELAEELGLDPSPELAELEHQILEHDPALLPASHQHHRLRGYELNEVIGEGAFSLVWRGLQPTLHRTVAVKQIRAELANQPDFIRHFETEAQTVAALEHPHIVPLYDYWREPDSAYLVMRYVAGGSLESAVLQRGLDDGRLRRLVDQVGSALHTAHRAGVIHRDVKSANVLIDDDNFWLTDFGIAFTGSAADDELANALSTGSPAYASPEQLRRQELDSRTDIYGFGITLFEAATGRLPFVDAPTQATIVQRQLEDPVPAPSSVDPSVPRWVDEVVARATAKNPADRFGSMVELMAAVPPGAMAGTDHGRSLAPATVIGELVNPFKALRAFREADAGDFYGRDRLVARFVEVLARPGTAGRLLAVVGPSGSGKSSAVRSGLVPKLRSGAVPGSDDWFITTMLPGARPFEELESALSRVAIRQPGPLVEMMRGDERGIARAVSQILPDEESELFLVIDQFEEMFTHAVDEERSRFLDGLLAAVREPRARLRVAVTIRADFWDRPLRHPGLAARLETAAVTVSPLAADELEAAVVEPVRRQGAAYEPGLVARILADVGDQPGALPLLQYALTELFDTHVSGLIRAESYDQIGGLTGALAKRAEETLTAMPPDEQEVARRLFGRLVTLGEGTEDTRRRVRLAELGDGADAVIAAFGAARLLVFDRDPITREPTVEIAHEALLQAWPRLRGWLDDDRDGLRIHRHLTDTTSAWLASGRDAGELYRGGRLETAAAWAGDHRFDLNSEEIDFLDTSSAASEAEQAAEREHLEHQERSNRRLRVLIAIATVVAVVAVAAGVFALGERSRADDEADEAQRQAEAAEEARAGAEQSQAGAEEARANAEAAQAHAEVSAAEAVTQRIDAEAARDSEKASLLRADFDRLVSLARSTDPEDPTLGLLLAVEAYRMWGETGSANFDAETPVERLDALHRALTARPGFMGSLPTGRIADDISVIGNGERIVAHTRDSIGLWDVDSRSEVAAWPAPVADGSNRFDIRTTAAASGDLVVAVGPTEAMFIDVPSGDVRVFQHATAATAVGLSADEQRVAVGFSDGRVAIREIADGSETASFDFGSGAVHEIVWHPNATQLAIAADEGAGVFSIDTMEATWRTDGKAKTLLPSTDGDRLAISFELDRNDPAALFAAGEMRIVETATGDEIVDRIELDAFARRLAWAGTDEEAVFATAGNRLLRVAPDEEARVVDVGSVRAISHAVAVLPGRDLVVTATGSGVELRSTDGDGPLSRMVPRTSAQSVPGSFLVGAFDEFGTHFVASTVLGVEQPQLFDLTEDTLEPEPWDGFDGAGGSVVIGPASTASPFMVHRSAGAVVVRRGLDGVEQGPPIVLPEGSFFSALSPTGDRLAIQDGQDLLLYEVASGALLSRLAGVYIPRFSPDGEVVHGWNGFTSARFDALTGERIWSSTEWGYAYPGPSDQWFATPDKDGAVQFRDIESKQPVGEPLIGHVGLVTHLEYDPVFDRVATAGQDSVTRVWDVDSRQQLGRELPTILTGRRTWSPDGTLLALPGPDGFVIWNYDTDTWADIACEVAGRSLTEAEWNEFGPRRRPFHETCPVPSGL